MVRCTGPSHIEDPIIFSQKPKTSQFCVGGTVAGPVHTGPSIVDGPVHPGC
jgi:hypothetical protein